MERIETGLDALWGPRQPVASRIYSAGFGYGKLSSKKKSVSLSFDFNLIFWTWVHQVVIEGVRGTGYVGDSAIDDVQLTQGEECMAALRRMMADTIVPGKFNQQVSFGGL